MKSQKSLTDALLIANTISDMCKDAIVSCCVDSSMLKTQHEILQTLNIVESIQICHSIGDAVKDFHLSKLTALQHTLKERLNRLETTKKESLDKELQKSQSKATTPKKNDILFKNKRKEEEKLDKMSLSEDEEPEENILLHAKKKLSKSADFTKNQQQTSSPNDDKKSLAKTQKDGKEPKSSTKSNASDEVEEVEERPETNTGKKAKKRKNDNIGSEEPNPKKQKTSSEDKGSTKKPKKREKNQQSPQNSGKEDMDNEDTDDFMESKTPKKKKNERKDEETEKDNSSGKKSEKKGKKSEEPKKRGRKPKKSKELSSKDQKKSKNDEEIAKKIEDSNKEKDENRKKSSSAKSESHSGSDTKKTGQSESKGEIVVSAAKGSDIYSTRIQKIGNFFAQQRGSDIKKVKNTENEKNVSAEKAQNASKLMQSPNIVNSPTIRKPATSPSPSTLNGSQNAVTSPGVDKSTSKNLEHSEKTQTADAENASMDEDDAKEEEEEEEEEKDQIDSNINDVNEKTDNKKSDEDLGNKSEEIVENEVNEIQKPVNNWKGLPMEHDIHTNVFNWNLLIDEIISKWSKDSKVVEITTEVCTSLLNIFKLFFNDFDQSVLPHDGEHQQYLDAFKNLNKKIETAIVTKISGKMEKKLSDYSPNSYKGEAILCLCRIDINTKTLLVHNVDPETTITDPVLKKQMTDFVSSLSIPPFWRETCEHKHNYLDERCPSLGKNPETGKPFSHIVCPCVNFGDSTSHSKNCIFRRYIVKLGFYDFVKCFSKNFKHIHEIETTYSRNLIPYVSEGKKYLAPLHEYIKEYPEGNGCFVCPALCGQSFNTVESWLDHLGLNIEKVRNNNFFDMFCDKNENDDEESKESEKRSIEENKKIFEEELKKYPLIIKLKCQKDSPREKETTAKVTRLFKQLSNLIMNKYSLTFRCAFIEMIAYFASYFKKRQLETPTEINKKIIEMFKEKFARWLKMGLSSLGLAMTVDQLSVNEVLPKLITNQKYREAMLELLAEMLPKISGSQKKPEPETEQKQEENQSDGLTVGSTSSKNSDSESEKDSSKESG